MATDKLLKPLTHDAKIAYCSISTLVSKIGSALTNDEFAGLLKVLRHDAKQTLKRLKAARKTAAKAETARIGGLTEYAEPTVEQAERGRRSAAERKKAEIRDERKSAGEAVFDEE